MVRVSASFMVVERDFSLESMAGGVEYEEDHRTWQHQIDDSLL